MHYGWRRRSGISHRRYWKSYWKALIVPLFAVAVILLGVLWEVNYGDADSSNRTKIAPAAGKPDVVFAAGPVLGDSGDATNAELDASRHEVASLHQELVEENLQITQGNAALISANQKVQTLEGQVATATQKQAEAKADRAEALRVARKMWEDWRSLRKNLAAACAALEAGNIKTAAPSCSGVDQK